MLSRSIKYQLAILSLLFSVFVAAVLFQMYFAHKMQQEEILQMQRSHKIISEYLKLEEKERKIYQLLEKCVSDPGNSRQKGLTKETGSLIDKWFEDLKIWKKYLGKWKHKGNIQLKNTVFDEIFVENKRRQATAYRKALISVIENKPDDAMAILRIEGSFLPPVNKTVISILEGIEIQIRNDRAIMKRFYFTTALAVLAALIALLAVSVSIFRNITSKLNLLKDGAKRVSEGDFTRKIELRSPIEFSSLATSFNDMQKAIKARDRKIREDAEKIRKMNEILEKKVLDSSKKIIQQNEALKRKNEELEQILYAASHDLRTPLISIQGFSEELKMACGELVKLFSDNAPPEKEKVESIVNDEVKLALNYIINGSKRMEMLLEALLRISRMGHQSLQIRELDMKKLLSDVKMNLEFQLSETGSELIIDEKLENCEADENQFEQVFTNLISNAIKYREPSRPCEIKIYSKKDEDFTHYYVEDNGIGIPEDHLPRIFHAFYRVDDDFSEGDGIGLAIVNRALDLHNGKAKVSSEFGKGTTFTVSMPNNINKVAENGT
jgi:signal transduction histidine kinase